jgi:hypothetical protein
MNSLCDDYIQLDRTFHELGFDAAAEDYVSIARLFRSRDALRWSDLLREHRTVLLSEAGSGKTEEIRNVARRLRDEGKAAFFIRIEYITRDFESSFEEGTYKEFCDWVNSGREGWLLLDSVDESRLREPGDFELAIRQLGRRIKPAYQRAHIVITSRPDAWRARTDLDLCRAEIPFQPIRVVVDDEKQSAQGDAATKAAKQEDNPTAPFKIVALDDIDGDRLETFIRAKGVQGVRAFRDAVERRDVWELTTRPQDLSELVEFWRERGEIGSRLDLYESSIERRLTERDQERLGAKPISKDRLKLGARLLAATTTLGHQQDIRVPDGASNGEGILAENVLTDWDDKDRAALLCRPLFDEAIYGTVRFHRSEVRELLTAGWLDGLLKNGASRGPIERLIFKIQYGTEVIVPTLRPVLPWLILFDEHIRERVCRIAPEVIFEGGDPGQLPREIRRDILLAICEQIAQPAHDNSMMDRRAVLRFANVDLAPDIKALLAQYGEDEDIVSFLTRMVWQGRIAELAPQMKSIALDAKSGEYARQAAIRALFDIGCEADKEEVRRALVAQEASIRHEWLAEIVPSLPADAVSLDWLLAALARSVAKGRYEAVFLPSVLSEAIVKWPVALLPRWVEGLQGLLSTPPFINEKFCPISQRYSWLVPLAAEAVLRLVLERHAAALNAPSLAILRSIPRADDFYSIQIGETKAALRDAIQGWTKLNHKLFWYQVAAVRAEKEAEAGARVTHFFDANPFRGFWRFQASDFATICADVTSRELGDDRLVALSLAFYLYVTNGRSLSWRERLKEIASQDDALDSELGKLLNPPKAEQEKLQKQEARFKREQERRKAKREENKRKWKEFIAEHRDEALTPENPASLTAAQRYLYGRVRETEDPSGELGSGDWRSLIPEFGEDVTRAYRDGAVRFWRHSHPALRSEGKEANTISFAAMFGLEGLAIESEEVPKWAERLSDKEARTAARLAMHELNGFPSWIASLYAPHPQVVIDLVMQEVDFELAHDDPSKGWRYALAMVGGSGQWLWDDIAPLFMQRLNKPLKNLPALHNMLTVVQGSSIPDEDLRGLFRKKAHVTKNVERQPLWFASWVGVELDAAIPALVARLEAIQPEVERTNFAMRFIVSLMGRWRNSSSVRQSFRTVPHMKALLLLTHQHVRIQDDLHHEGTYSPGLRDGAQDARSALFAFLRKTPGKEAFLALSEIAWSHPDESHRPWMMFWAKRKATEDADLAPWSPSQVREFNDYAERTPRTHRELWELAVSRLYDLKHDLENGDSSIASILIKSARETEYRNFIGDWCRERSAGRYSIVQEEELADARRPDLRFALSTLDAPVPVEIKIADKWSGPELHERLEVQLCGDYLRDVRSSRGIFLLIYRGNQSSWVLPNGSRATSFQALVDALKNHWSSISTRYPGIDDIDVIGLDLTVRRD